MCSTMLQDSDWKTVLATQVITRATTTLLKARITDDWEGYLQRMESEHVWGGEPELVVSVNIIKRPITVYRPVRGVVEPVITYGQELGRTPVSLLWGGAHYELLLPTRPTLGS
ncbi:OTU domain-containing protein [Haematococcus lacustris]|uniref:OTU domain-containing protein n=1 Tax=Haematococcus lacustris TaxID=44745 RepID=A0A699YI39_HAELA|nr:OTU domain-containing protein [Haematococcus lacustris]